MSLYERRLEECAKFFAFLSVTDIHLLHTCTTKWGSLRFPDVPPVVLSSQRKPVEKHFSLEFLVFLNCCANPHAVFQNLLTFHLPSSYQHFWYSSLPSLLCQCWNILWAQPLLRGVCHSLEFMSFVCFTISDLWWVQGKSGFFTVSGSFSLLHFYILRKSGTLSLPLKKYTDLVTWFFFSLTCRGFTYNLEFVLHQDITGMCFILFYICLLYIGQSNIRSTHICIRSRDLFKINGIKTQVL